MALPNLAAARRMRSLVSSGSSVLRIVMRDLALLPLLHGPRGFANVIHGVPEIHKYALVDAAGAHRLLQLQ